MRLVKLRTGWSGQVKDRRCPDHEADKKSSQHRPGLARPAGARRRQLVMQQGSRLCVHARAFNSKQ
jgi:hypothetical protein